MANGIFPFIDGDISLFEDISSDYTLPLYKEVAFDFKTENVIIKDGELQIVEGLEAIKVWIWKAIKTSRFEFDIYSWDFGSEITSLLGKGFSRGFITSEVKRYIKEALLINPYIISIDSIEISFSGDILSVETHITTIYGTGKITI